MFTTRCARQGRRPARPMPLLLAALTLLAILGACGTSSPAPAPASPASSSPAPASPASSSPASSSPSASVPSSPLVSVMGRRCGSPDRTSSARDVAGPDGSRLRLSTVGSGTTVALLLHQTDGGASCGWWPFATHLATSGVRVVMLDFCNFGESSCPTASSFATDYPAQVSVAARSVRADGALRLVVVGASLGGTVAVNAAAAVKADAVVDLSGFGFGPLETAAPIAALRMPLLAAGSPEDGPDTDRLEAEVTASPDPRADFVRVDSGHGWNMLLEGPFTTSPPSDLGRSVMHWVREGTAG